MGSIVIKRITDKAERLAEVRTAINALEEEVKLKVDALKKERDELQEELIASLKKESLTTIKTSAGESYTLAKRKGISIVNEIFALKWAMENRAVSINKILVAQKLKDAKEMPSGFEAVESEYISVRKPKANPAEAEAKSDES